MALPSQIGPPRTLQGNPISFDCLGCFSVQPIILSGQVPEGVSGSAHSRSQRYYDRLSLPFPQLQTTGSGQCGAALAPSYQEI